MDPYEQKARLLAYSVLLALGTSIFTEASFIKLAKMRFHAIFVFFAAIVMALAGPDIQGARGKVNENIQVDHGDASMVNDMTDNFVATSTETSDTSTTMVGSSSASSSEVTPTAKSPTSSAAISTGAAIPKGVQVGGSVLAGFAAVILAMA
ncbi:hypothetical protein P8C59_006055 [Phyllachora maydis]|uniref:Uncharacterized protein n=1 Tax=Phyllachora maydis TaxID=1825666 RepID=A0AAD9I6Q6_9PEZI|nr:hypothetical protein P8C59_006055 [Phyllachora maydis]